MSQPWLNERWPQNLFAMEPTHDGVARMIRYCARFARSGLLRARPLPWVVLAGKTGCGKTRAAKRAIRIIRETAIDAYLAGFWADPPSALFAEWPRMAEINRAEDYDESVSDLHAADVVALDDVGSESDRFRSGEGTSRFRRLLDRLEGKAVLITTNLRPSEWAKKWDARVASRMTAAHYLDCFDVPDFRVRKATT